MGAPEVGALTEAFEAERRGLLAHAYRMLGAHHEAEDVVQDTYVRALRGWETFERRSSVRTWLYRIATNVCLNMIEGRGRRARSLGLAPDDLAPDDVGPWLEPYPTDPADLVIARESVRLAFVAGLQHLGPRQRADSPYSGVIALFIAAMGAGRAPTVHGDGLQSRDFTYVANAVQALIKAAEAPGVSGNVYNVGTGRSVTVLDLVAALNRLLGTRLVPKHVPPRAGDVRFSRADISRARRDLGYEPAVSFEEGLERTLRWYREKA